ncbi:MAG TPA: outer membrane beta-barrel protein [Blastocatellia bacterium]|nr:outer membrane beta-barrel protein [Blastocatellia bacterium]
MKLPLTITALLLCSLTAMAQEYPSVEAFGGYSYLRADGETIDLNQFGAPGNARQKASNLNGFNLGVVLNPHPTVGIAIDFSGHYGSTEYTLTPPIFLPNPYLATGRFSTKTSFHTFLLGPQFHLRRGDNTLFVRPMLGFSHARERVKVTTTTPGLPGPSSETSFAFSFGGGYDRRVSDRVAVRLFQADYLLTTFDQGFGANSQSNFRFSTGLTFGNYR